MVALFVEPDSQPELNQANLNSAVGRKFGAESPGCPCEHRLAKDPAYHETSTAVSRKFMYSLTVSHCFRRVVGPPTHPGSRMRLGRGHHPQRAHARPAPHIRRCGSGRTRTPRWCSSWVWCIAAACKFEPMGSALRCSARSLRRHRATSRLVFAGDSVRALYAGTGYGRHALRRRRFAHHDV